jgi:hypothetical protein
LKNTFYEDFGKIVAIGSRSAQNKKFATGGASGGAWRRARWFRDMY